MIAAGDVHLADLGDELRRRVLVVSSEQFNRRSDQVLVVPALPFDDDEILDPWRVAAGGWVHAVDLVAGIPASRLLDRVDRLSGAQINSVRRALHAIT